MGQRGLVTVDGPLLWVVNVLVWLRHPRNVAYFRRRVGHFPNVSQPIRYNDKMLWRKVFDHNPIFGTFSDKLATKRHTSQLCPTLRLPAVMWTGEDVSTIPQETLRQPLIIKANHGSGMNVVLGGGEPTTLAVAEINDWIKKPYGTTKLEWGYRFAQRTLLAEELIVPDEGEDLVDLSVHTIDGTPLFIEAITGHKSAGMRKSYFRVDGTRWPDLERNPRAIPSLPPDFRLPSCHLEALDHARVLGAGVDYIRIDFMVAGERLYGGEITVYPGSGINRNAEFLVYNSVLSEHWDLSTSWFVTARHRGCRRLYAEALGRVLRRRKALRRERRRTPST